MSDRTRCLLDKVTARRILEGLLKLAEGRDLSGEEWFAVDLFYRAGSHSIELFIATFDQPLIRQWATQRGAIRERWQTMRDDLPAPYRDAPLPDV